MKIRTTSIYKVKEVMDAHNKVGLTEPYSLIRMPNRTKSTVSLHPVLETTGTLKILLENRCKMSILLIIQEWVLLIRTIGLRQHRILIKVLNRLMISLRKRIK